MHLIVNRGLWPADAGRGKGWPGLLGVAWLPGLGSDSTWHLIVNPGLWPAGAGLLVANGPVTGLLGS